MGLRQKAMDQHVEASILLEGQVVSLKLYNGVI
jgi:hypothetical protein